MPNSVGAVRTPRANQWSAVRVACHRLPAVPLCTTVSCLRLILLPTASKCPEPKARKKTKAGFVPFAVSG